VVITKNAFRLQRHLGKLRPIRASICHLVRCPAGEKLTHRYTNVEDGKTLRRYWTTARSRCPTQIAMHDPSGASRDGARAQCSKPCRRLDKNPKAIATLKMRMGSTHFLMRRLPKFAAEMALHVLAYNLTRVMNVIGVQPLLTLVRA
jgi:hypothetical protein